MMKLFRTLLATLIALWIAAPVLASLGGDEASVERDRASMKGTARVTPGVDYSVHEIQTAAGTVVHEYVSAQGKVFAVSWRGPATPDLAELLGSYAATLQRSATHPHYDHHRLDIQAPDVVMHSGGHLRTRYGQAWVPSLLPQNFSPRDIG